MLKLVRARTVYPPQSDPYIDLDPGVTVSVLNIVLADFAWLRADTNSDIADNIYSDDEKMQDSFNLSSQLMEYANIALMSDSDDLQDRAFDVLLDGFGLFGIASENPPEMLKPIVQNLKHYLHEKVFHPIIVGEELAEKDLQAKRHRLAAYCNLLVRK